MAEMTKHVGLYGDKPCVVVFRELPEEADQALIVISDSLEGQFHDDIMSVVDSPEGQESNNVSEVFFRRRLTDGENMLEALHTRGKLTKVPVDMVKLTPAPNQAVELAEVNAELQKIETGSNPPLVTEQNVENLSQGDVPVDEAEDQNQVAQNLLSQASLLREDAKVLLGDADSKEEEAYKLAPELKPKKGPGRPPKSASLDV
tara:strand:+ start:213 stop:821 length:609 start_codon:yes stop_codon:yes gene_type:complete